MGISSNPGNRAILSRMDLPNAEELSEGVRSVFEVPAYWQCVSAALDSRELVEQFDRLHGTNLLGKGTPIERMIDQTTGKLVRDVFRFLEFVYEAIYSRLPPEAFEVLPLRVTAVRPAP